MDKQEAKFSAVLPSTMTAIRIHGDCGARITFDIEDGIRNENIEQVKKLMDWRNQALEVTVRPVPK